MREWSISIYLVGPEGEQLPATCFEKATYHLHESFGPKRAKQTFKNAPFTINEKGWGEFDMIIQLTPVGSPKNGDASLQHDLNFQQEEYESTHSVVRSTYPTLAYVCLLTDVHRPSATPNPTSSPNSRSRHPPARLSTALCSPLSPPPVPRRPPATSTWRSSPKPYPY